MKTSIIAGLIALPAVWPSPGRIERVGELRTARSVHSMTVLASGQILVAGGMADGGGGMASAELIDGATGRVSPLPPLNTARAGHTATLLPDGRVVIAGGYNGDYLRSVEVFDPRTRRFASLGAMSEGRSGHTATLLPDGRILVAGGVGTGWSFLASAELFDPATGRSQAVGPLHAARESHTATLLADGRVLITGGHRGRRAAMEVYAGAELYDPATQRFSATGSLGTPRHKHDAVRLPDGRVLVLGGADRTDRNWFATTELFDPASGKFSAGPSMASPRYKFQGTSLLLPSGDVLVSGGAGTAEVLDIRRLAFHRVEGGFPAGYHFAAAVLLASGDVVVAGGYDDRNRNTAGVWRFRRSAQ